MLEQTTRLVSENLARAFNRRTFLKRTGETAFLGLAALAAGHAMPGRASAGSAGGGPTPPTPPRCAPPGPYCNLTGTNDPNGCHGSACFQHMVGGQVYQCQVYYTYYQAGCWTTAEGAGYWTCCDCRCTNGSTCGCAQYSTAPVPRPDSPGGGTSA
jgi:hypothetical protein